MKRQRQEAILNMIENNVIDTQKGLQDALTDMGFEVTQATVSRDIKELRIVKALDSEGRYRYIQNARSSGYDMPPRFSDIFSNSVVSVNYAMNDVVIKCHPGTASGACVVLDSMFESSVLGTLAGDDTILAITKDEESAAKLVEDLKELL